MKKDIVLLALVFLFSACTPSDPISRRDGMLNPSETAKKGDWESSGGLGDPPSNSLIFDDNERLIIEEGGILCFTDKESLEKSQVSLQDQEYLEGNTTSFTTLEMYEHFNVPSGKKVWTRLLDISNEDEVVLEVLKRIRRYSPIFAQKLDVALKSVKREEQVSIEQPPYLLKASSGLELKDNCQFIRLAARTSVSASEHMPQVEVHFDEVYYNQLSTIDRAILIFHEALVLVANKTSSKDASEIREITSELFSDDPLDISYLPIFSDASKMIQNYLDSYFDTYVHAFMSEDFYSDKEEFVSIRHMNNFTRMASLSELDDKIKSYVKTCQNTGATKSDCEDKLIFGGGEELVSIIDTEEKAFVFLSMHKLDLGMQSWTVESLYIQNMKNLKSENFLIRVYLGVACGKYKDMALAEVRDLKKDDIGNLVLDRGDQNKIKQKFSTSVLLKDLLVPSLRYCKRIIIQ